MKALTSALVFFLFTGHAAGRLGETPAEFTARYGGGVKDQAPGGATHYQKNGFLVIAYFNADGKCDQIGFMKPREGAPVEITETEIQTLISANLPGGANEVERTPSGLVWRDSSGAGAIYLPGEGLLILTTAEGQRRGVQNQTEKEKGNLKGF